MMKDNYTNPLSQLTVAALFVILTIIALYIFVTVAEPLERKPGTKAAGGYSEQPLLSALTEQNLQSTIAQIKAASTDGKTGLVSRLSGSAGCYNTEKLVTDTFNRAGLQVDTQEFSVVVPVTEYCEILDESSHPLPGVKLLPVEPAGLLPTALPESGVSGDLVVMGSTQPLDLVKKPVEGSIALVNGIPAGLPTADSFWWSTLAAMGARALIVKEDPAASNTVDSLKVWQTLAPPYDVKFPRFLVQGPIERYANHKLRIRCKVTWQSRPVRNIIGVLPGSTPQGGAAAKEALIVTSYYDSNSMVPDMAPGAEQAMPLATMLNLVKGLAPYKGQIHRDIVFVAMAAHCQAHEGATRLLEAIETISKKVHGKFALQDELDDHQQKLKYLDEAQQILDSPDPWKTTDNAEYRDKIWSKYDAGFRKWFEHCFATVAGEIDLQRKEDYLKVRLAWIRGGSPTFHDGFDPSKASAADRVKPENRHPLMQAYLDEKLRETRAATQISTPFWMVASQLQFADFDAWGYRTQMLAYLRTLQAYHLQRVKELQDSLRVRGLFAHYAKTLTVNIIVNSGGVTEKKDLAVLLGQENQGTVLEPQSTELRNTLLANVPLNGTDPIFKVKSWGTNDRLGANTEAPNVFPGGGSISTLESYAWFRSARLAYTIGNLYFAPPKIGSPADTFEGIKTATLALQMPVIGKTLLSMGFGKIAFKKIDFNAAAGDIMRDCYGTVLTAASTSSSVPDHPMGVNTFVHIHQVDMSVPPKVWGDNQGVRLLPIIQVNPYGEYRHRYTFDLSHDPNRKMMVDAARFADDGTLLYYDDNSSTSQTIFNSQAVLENDVKLDATKPVNVPVFRGCLVECYQRVNPKTLNSYARFDYLSYPGLTEPTMNYVSPFAASPAATAFLEPDCRFGIAMLDGSAQNPEIQTYRAFALNVDSEKPASADEQELFGRGYLAADVTDPDPDNKYAHLTMLYFDAAKTMLRTNEKRLRLQRYYHMADTQMDESHNNAITLLGQAQKSRLQGDSMSAMNDSGRGLAYATNNHPVIREKISNAVLGILWYLILLVPFVFFFEKLLFGFTDIRKQLLAHGVIFVGVFLLLQAFHPAFHMVRSSLMILLGFLIFLLSVIVTLFVTGRFEQTIKGLRKNEGTVEGADVNRAGVVGTAFMLGLNNMRRRKVRTTLTCVTLTLITFVMICFTSVTTSMQDVEYMTGRSPANGIMRRDPNFLTLKDDEINNIKQIYGLKYPVAVTYWVTGLLNPWAPLKNPDLTLDRAFQAGSAMIHKSAKVNSAMTMSWNEPLFSGLDKYLLTSKGWFPHPPETPQDTAELEKKGLKLPLPDYIIIPDNVAKALGLTENEVNTGHPMLKLGANDYEVWGIFDAQKMTQHVGMDGEKILPYDLNTVQTVGMSSDGKANVVPETIGRMTADRVVITSKAPTIDTNTQQNVAVSCAILFPSQPYRLRSDQPILPPVTYKEQRSLVAEYLEQIGIGAYYSVAGVSYYGSRTRTKSFSGLIELLIPLLIAALTVFNTMRSSVYERKEEIYVYNAVGIAPNHIFFMFMAEACVYAVIGAMAGYLLSQVSMSVLTLSCPKLVAGLNMDYSSIETIYASLAIVVSVLLSTLVPARTASRLALPSDEASWTVPKPDGDTLRFHLPFTFGAHDRVAIISYFYRWLDANGEGSSGPFYCAPPKPRTDYDESETRSGGLIPEIETTIWLKPYDLGVSQRLRISLPTDPETGEYIASITIERLSGTMSAWNRAVMPFLGALRKQFLSWRAVSDAERAEMFEEAKSLFIHTTIEDRETANV